MSDTVWRVADAILAIFWLWVLITALRTGFIGPRGYHRPTRLSHPLLFWAMIAIFALMVVHFGGLAITRQAV
ncbi:MAG: hypothetical protein WCY11_07460 [Novosphingobium sp.]